MENPNNITLNIDTAWLKLKSKIYKQLSQMAVKTT